MFPLEWGRYHPGPPSGNDDLKYSWSVPYFHAHDKINTQNSWNSIEDAADNALQDGQIADQAIYIAENKTKPK